MDNEIIFIMQFCVGVIIGYVLMSLYLAHKFKNKSNGFTKRTHITKIDKEYFDDNI